MNFLFAQIAPPSAPLVTKAHGLPSEVTILLVAVAIIVLGFVIWAVFFRRSPEEMTGWGPSHSKYRPSADAGPSADSQRRRKWRRRRREHRPRNPTLAETGGLPPVRQDKSSSDPGA